MPPIGAMLVLGIFHPCKFNGEGQCMKWAHRIPNFLELVVNLNLSLIFIKKKFVASGYYFSSCFRENAVAKPQSLDGDCKNQYVVHEPVARCAICQALVNLDFGRTCIPF